LNATTRATQEGPIGAGHDMTFTLARHSEFFDMAGHDDKARNNRQNGLAYGRDAANVDSRVQTEIGKHLRAIYDDVINEPVPDRFLELLAQLERSTQRGR
jgi:Anti-sigma factor NepR